MGAAGRIMAPGPGADFFGPFVQTRIGVAAGVQFFRAVHANVNKISGGIVQHWPFAGGVGGDQRDPMSSQEFDE